MLKLVIDKLLESIVPYITGTLEFIGVTIITVESIRAIVSFIKNKFDFQEDRIGVEFARAMSLSLEFKLAAEIIKTVVIRDLDEFVILAAVATLRVVITVVLHWELKSGTKKVVEREGDRK